MLLCIEKGLRAILCFFATSPADKARYPGPKNLWDMGFDLFISETMHQSLCNVVRRLRNLLFGEDEKLVDDQLCLIPKARCEAIGRKIRAGRPTVLLSQAQGFRDMSELLGSYEAVD